MNFNVIATDYFERRIKRLAKKYKSLVIDFQTLIDELAENPTLGTPLGKDCFKIRLAISSKGKGKSGGARLITYVLVTQKTVYLVDIYDKSEQANITENELKSFIALLTS